MRVALTKSLEHRITSFLMSHPNGHERGGVLFLRKFSDTTFGTSDRYVVVDFRPFEETEILESSPFSMKFSMRQLPKDFFLCERESLIFGVVHCHPSGGLSFSEKDEQCEQSLISAIANHTTKDSEIVSLLFAENKWIGRCRTGFSPREHTATRHVCIFGEHIFLHFQPDDALRHWNTRQAAAFGAPFNDALQSMRVAVVGLGGTGSPLAQTALRAGVGELVLIDGDDVETTNLNRTAGYRIKDIGTKKATRSKEFLDEIGLDCDIRAIAEYVDRSPSGVDALSTCDVVFGCTDDVIGRNTMNEAAYYYCNPFIDVGLTGRIDGHDKKIPKLREHKARISTIMPESGRCLRCQRVVTDDKLAYAFAVRDRPEIATMGKERLRREFYLTGGGEAAPGVGPFTTAAAQFSFMSFMDLLKPFRNLGESFRRDNLWIDFISLEMYSNMPKNDSSCYCCGAPGLLNVDEGEFRLQTPLLGKR